MKRFILRSPEVREACIGFIQDLDLDEKKPFLVEIKLHKKNRSAEQNRYYWFILNLISDYTGDDPDSLHEFFKDALLPKEMVGVGGEIREVTISTTQLKTDEFTKYIEQVAHFASNKLGIIVPHPGEHLDLMPEYQKDNRIED